MAFAVVAAPHACKFRANKTSPFHIQSNSYHMCSCPQMEQHFVTQLMSVTLFHQPKLPTDSQSSIVKKK
jgi:hypothetical protein